MSVATRKRARDDADWKITFEDTVSLRCVVESVAAVMSRVTFKVQKVNEFFYLAVDGADMGYTCCVSARLKLESVTYAQGYTENEEFTFCVDCKQLLYSIDNSMATHAQLCLEGHLEDASVHIVMHDPDSRNTLARATLKTFVDREEQESLCALDYTTHLEIDLAKLRDMVKTARKAHAEHLNIKIFRKTQGSREISVVTFFVDGETSHEQGFCNEILKQDDGSILVRATSDCAGHEYMDLDDIPIIFNGTFPIEKIDAFVKNIHVRMIDARVQNGMPLMLTHQLGSGDDDTSHVRFLVGPRNDES